MTTQSWKKGAVTAWTAVAVLIVIAIITAISWSFGSRDVSDEPPTPTGDGNGANPAVVKLLKVTSVTERCETVTKRHVVKYDVGALKGVPPRKWSDSVSTPLHGGLQGVKGAVCHDPLYGATVANMLAGLRVDGVSVVSLNPWLKPYQATSQINDHAEAFVPLLDVKSPSSAQVKAAVRENHDYQQLANRVNTLLSRFQVQGTDTLRSVKNWHLKAAGLKVDGLPEIGLDSRVDAKPALILEATLKNACAPVVRVGFNLGDKRPEVFVTPSCKKPGKPTAPSHPTTPGHPNPPGHPTPPSHPTPTPKCPPTPGNEPTGGPHHWSYATCSWIKDSQSFDQQQNQSQAHQDVQDNDGTDTGGTSGAGDGSSSPSNGGSGSAPTGGDSGGGGGTTPTTDPSPGVDNTAGANPSPPPGG